MKYSHSLVVSGALLTLITNSTWAAQSVYIPLGDASKVQIIDTNTHQLADTIDDVGNAHGLAMTPDRRYLVAGSFNESSPDDPTIPRPEGVTEEEHEKHHDLAATDHAKNAGTSFVSIIDTVNRKVIRRVAVTGAVHHVAISPDGEFAVATHPGTGRISIIELRHFTLTAEQRHFKQLLSQYPRLETYWDFNTRDCDLERLRSDLGMLSTGEAVMARFLIAVWLGENKLDFDLIEAAKTLDSVHLEVIANWVSGPEFP